MKRCTKCEKEFPRTSEFFSLDKRNKDGLAASCRICDRERNRLRMRRIREENPGLGTLYYAENRDKERDRVARWVRQNPDKERERVARWASENRDKRNDNEKRRRAQKLKSEQHYTSADVQTQYKNQNGKCHWCDVEVGNDYHVDHVIPLSRGGSNGPENIVIACPTCNLSKGDRLPYEWPDGGRLL